MRIAQARNFIKMISRRSYYHMPQGMGRNFSPQSLAGYFNDMTAKVNWQGKTNESGVPAIKMATGEFIYAPVTVIQKALGHFDIWIDRHETAHFREFLKLADWVTNQQDDDGGWDCWSHMQNNTTSIYSAMVQGEAMSLLARAFKYTNKSKYKHALEKSWDIMQRPVSDGGVCRLIEENEIFLEEVPTCDIGVILNGWIYAIFGLHDYLLITKNLSVTAFFKDTLSTLIRNIDRYDTGYWSYYDLLGNLASPFYHSLHISQIEALEMISESRKLKRIKLKWNMI